MKTWRKYFLSISTTALVFLVGLSQTSAVLAASGNSTPGTSAYPGIQSPTGADAGTFTYDPTTGIWSNAYYTWSTVTKTETPITPIVYTYDPSTGMWDYSQWEYDAASGQYVQDNLSVVQPPAGASTVGGPVAVESPDSSSATGPDSTSDLSNNQNNNSNQNNLNNVTVGNGLNSTAASGNADVSGNTSAGDATTGNAAAIANIMNLIQSSSGLNGLQATTFNANINGDVQGNLVIDPGALNNLQSPGSTNLVSNDLTNNLTTNTTNNSQINNNLNLGAESGNAGVTGNTSGGNATSGSAVAMANVINMIDSMIAANQSFIGNINIYGNLTGNILLPQQFLDNLIASNAPSTTINTSELNNISNDINNNEAINNSVNASSSSGAANVADNTNAGNATTGNASTNLTIFNLTGDQIVGQNTILVFVNVLGNWVGMLMNAPAGTTAAAYGGGITQDNKLTNNLSNVVNNNEAINNNLNLGAKSGDANVADNTNAGNATTGNAESGANLLNIENSQFNLSNWFGILFINVFGNWYGNFGAESPTIASSDVATTSSGGSGSDSSISNPSFNFVPISSNDAQILKTISTVSSNNGIHLVNSFLKANPASSKAEAATEKNTAARDRMTDEFFAATALIIGLALLIAERVMKARKTHQSLKLK